MDSARPLSGVLLFVLGLFLFACMDTTVKYLTARYPVPAVAALRYMVHGLLMVVLLAPTEGRRLVQTQRTGWVLVRALCLAGATLFMGLALQRMPVAETTAMVFISPLLVVLVAGPLLGEKVGPFDWIAALLGFLGILLIARPGGATDVAGVLYALGAAAVMTGYQLLSRTLAATERTIAMLFHTALLGSLLFGLALPWSWQGPLPPLPHVGLFLIVGACGGMGHYLFTAAYRQTPASALAPLTYVQLLWAVLLGWLVFDHVPDALSVAGMCVVTACGISAAIRSHRSRPRADVPVDVEP
ncbi:MAG TPA: DMT family transporter [Solimonas sp.]|nr:DMT family transporter [Solimonas sp.]